VKTTEYFRYRRLSMDRRSIDLEWVERALAQYDYEEIQTDGRIRRWVWIPEAGRTLRVILLEDGMTVHNAFFDRRFNADRTP